MGGVSPLMRLYKIWVQHMSNPLHIYCRLIDMGFSMKSSRRLGTFYEKHFYPGMFKGLRAKCISFVKRSW